MTARELGGYGHRRLDRLHQLVRGGQLPATPSPDDRASDLAGVALLAVLAQQTREPPLIPRVDDLLCRQLLTWIHPHVERCVVGVRESPLPGIHLHRGHAEIEIDQIRA